MLAKIGVPIDKEVGEYGYYTIIYKWSYQHLPDVDKRTFTFNVGTSRAWNNGWGSYQRLATCDR